MYSASSGWSVLILPLSIFSIFDRNRADFPLSFTVENVLALKPGTVRHFRFMVAVRVVFQSDLTIQKERAVSDPRTVFDPDHDGLPFRPQRIAMHEVFCSQPRSYMSMITSVNRSVRFSITGRAQENPKNLV